MYINIVARRVFGDSTGLLISALFDESTRESDSTSDGTKRSDVITIRSGLRRCNLLDGSSRELLLEVDCDASENIGTVVFLDPEIGLLRAVRTIAAALIQRHKLDEILNVITVEARRLCRAERAYIKLHNEATNQLEFKALSSVIPKEKFRQSSSPPDRGMTGYVFANRKPYRSANVANEPSEKYYALFETSSKLVVPLLLSSSDSSISKLDCIGVLSVDGFRQDQFDQHDEDVLLVLADHASIAIAQFRLVEEAQHAWSALLSAQESANIRLAAHLLHDAKNFVAVIKSGLTEILDHPVTNRVGGLWSTQLNAFIDKAADVQHTLGEVAVHLQQQLSNSDTGEEPEYVDLYTLARRAVNILPEAGSTPVRLDADNRRTQTYNAYTHPTKLLLVLYNLLVNALTAMKKTRAEGEILIEIGPSPYGEGYCRVRISDEGPGIPSGTLALIRSKQRTPTDAITGGSGLGLLSIREVISEAHGHFDIQSRVGGGTSIILDLPGQIATKGKQ
ncbi:MAG: ATP-binding protein [Gemmatimonadota bacterium]